MLQRLKSMFPQIQKPLAPSKIKQGVDGYKTYLLTYD